MQQAKEMSQPKSMQVLMACAMTGAVGVKSSESSLGRMNGTMAPAEAAQRIQVVHERNRERVWPLKWLTRKDPHPAASIVRRLQLDDIAAALYAGPPEEFTTARNARAKDLDDRALGHAVQDQGAVQRRQHPRRQHRQRGGAGGVRRRRAGQHRNPAHCAAVARRRHMATPRAGGHAPRTALDALGPGQRRQCAVLRGRDVHAQRRRLALPLTATPTTHRAMALSRKPHLDSLAISLLLACCMFWGFQQVLVKATVAEVAPVFQAFVRFALATVAVAV